MKLTCENNFVVSSSEDNELAIYDLVDKICVKRLQGHTKEVVTLDIHPFNENEGVSGSLDGTLWTWN